MRQTVWALFLKLLIEKAALLGDGGRGWGYGDKEKLRYHWSSIRTSKGGLTISSSPQEEKDC